MNDLVAVSQILRRNVDAVRQRIDAATQRGGRTSGDVQMIAVTKYVDIEVTRCLAEIGVKNLGESRPQVLWKKADGILDPAVEWHMIGHLQRNKVKRTVEIATLIHSVDSERLLNEINHVALASKKVMDVLIEVNISGEPSKQGLNGDEVATLLELAKSKENIRVNGLMGMGGLASDPDLVRREFSELRKMRDCLATSHFDNPAQFHHLSMGMSRDFEIAIEEGATLVRIGSILFDGII